MGKLIYVVTSGSYSDYGINCIYDDKALADKAVEMGYGEDIEEYELNDYSDALRAGRANYDVWAWMDGDSNVSARLNLNSPRPLEVKQQWDYLFGTGRVFRWWFSGTVEASSSDHAKKIAAEKIAQIKAEGGAPGVTVKPPQQVSTS